VQQRSESSCKDSSNKNEINAAETAAAGGPQFAEVAVPVHVSSTFIYRLPISLRHLAEPGSRIVVPLGKKFVTGYIVGLLENLSAGTSLQESDVKEAKEILDTIPLVPPELLDLTRWVADYYLAPWGEVIKAALPPGISPKIDSFLSITESGRAELRDSSLNDTPAIKQRLLQLVGEAEEISLAAASNELGSAQTPRLARELECDGLVEIMQRPGTEFVKPKVRRRVRLVEADETPWTRRDASSPKPRKEF